ncbi:MAG: hypothetical protein WCG34_12430, partial [Leptolinea sp.]
MDGDNSTFNQMQDFNNVNTSGLNMAQPLPPLPPLNSTQVIPAAPIPTAPMPPQQAAVVEAPVLQRTDNFDALMDEEHHLMRELPKEATDINAEGVKLMRGPDFTPAAMTPAAMTAANAPIGGVPYNQIVAQNSAQTVVAAVTNATDANVAFQNEQLQALTPALTNIPAPEGHAAEIGMNQEEMASYKSQLDDLLSLAIEKDASDLH